MLPLRLNLLPPEKRQHLERMIYFQFTKNALEFLLICVCVSGIVLLGGQSVLQKYFNDLTEQVTSITNQYSKTNLQISNINKITKEVDKIQNVYTKWTTKMTELANVIPNSIILSSLNFNQGDKTISLSGTAPTREELLQLQESLKSITWIKSVEVPLPQLTSPKNIQFSITALLK